jgi:hypothetical protein
LRFNRIPVLLPAGEPVQENPYGRVPLTDKTLRCFMAVVALSSGTISDDQRVVRVLCLEIIHALIDLVERQRYRPLNATGLVHSRRSDIDENRLAAVVEHLRDGDVLDFTFMRHCIILGLCSDDATGCVPLTEEGNPSWRNKIYRQSGNRGEAQDDYHLPRNISIRYGHALYFKYAEISDLKGFMVTTGTAAYLTT